MISVLERPLRLDQPVARFRERQAYWRRELWEGPVKDTLEREVYPPAEEFFRRDRKLDPTHAAMIDFYRAYRACVRGKVLGFQTEYFRNSSVGQWRYYPLTKDMSPKTIDWDMWLGHKFQSVDGQPLGPSPKEQPFDRAVWAQWRCYWPFGGGMYTDLFVHRVTMMLKATGLRYPARVVGAVAAIVEVGDVRVRTIDLSTVTDEATRADYFESMYYSSAVVGVVTSAFLEAAIVGRPVLTMTRPEYRAHQEQMIHFRYLTSVEGGVLRTAANVAEHHAHLIAALELGGRRDERNRRFLEAFIRPDGLRGPATPMFVQAVDGLLHGTTFSSIRGLNWLGDHSSLILIPLAPVFALAPHAITLLGLQTLALAAGAVPVWLLARRELPAGPLPLACAALYLLQPALGYMNLFEFHPETLAVPFLLWGALEVRAGDLRPQVGVFQTWIALSDPPGRLEEPLEELVVHRTLHDQPCSSQTHLAGVVELVHGLLHDRLEIGVGERDERRLAPELE